MRKNVIILTSGLTGSSVLTALISRGGYWTGDLTHDKKEYDTFENRELIDLDLNLLSEVRYDGNYTMEFSSEMIRRIASLQGLIDDTPYRRFLDRCNQHRPWIWKDPRLWLTIRFWAHLLNLEECKFLLLTRDLMQCWVSSLLRRQIRTFQHCKDYEKRVSDSAIVFLKENELPYLHVRYEELIVHPGRTIDQLNGYLQTSLRVADLADVYRRPLYKTPRRSAFDHLKAGLVYVKNYSERVDIMPEGR